MTEGMTESLGEDTWWQDTLWNYTYGDDNSTDDGGDVCDLTLGVKFDAAFIPALYSLAFAVGILGNGVLLGVLFRSRRTWSVADTFILHLGVADFLLMMTLPLRTAQYADAGGWKFGQQLCKLTGTLYTVNFYCGIFLLVCISLDRYFSIVLATQMYTHKKPRVVHGSCFMVWLFSLLLSIPDWIFLEDIKDRLGRNMCVRNYAKFGSDGVLHWLMVSRTLYHTLGFLLPSSVLIFCYSSILQKLRCGNRSIQKQRAFKVIVTVVVVFFTCWTPFNITLIVDTLSRHQNTNSTCTAGGLEKAKQITQSLGYIHCCLNPLLYAFVGVKFRRQLLDIFRSLGCKLEMSKKFHTIGSSSRRSSFWSESADTSNSIAV